jgi:hypothetical protein
MRASGKLLAAAAIGAATVIVTPKDAFADFECNVLRSRVALLQGAQNTTSQQFVDIPGATAEVFAGPGPENCMIVEFDAQVRARSPGTLRLRAIIDGAAEIAPSFVEAYTSANNDTRRKAVFVLTNIDPGDAPHTVRVQFMSATGARVFISKGIMTVRYSGQPR